MNASRAGPTDVSASGGATGATTGATTGASTVKAGTVASGGGVGPTAAALYRASLAVGNSSVDTMAPTLRAALGYVWGLLAVHAPRLAAHLDRLGVGDAVAGKGVTWNVGRTFHREQEVFNFNLLPEAHHERRGKADFELLGEVGLCLRFLVDEVARTE